MGFSFYIIVINLILSYINLFIVNKRIFGLTTPELKIYKSFVFSATVIFIINLVLTYTVSFNIASIFNLIVLTLLVMSDFYFFKKYEPLKN